MIKHSFFSVAVVAIVAAATLGCSTASQPSGCDVSFSDANAAGLMTTAFHDSTATALYWTPRLNPLDVLGGDLPSRAFELELTGVPIVEGATMALGKPIPGDPLHATPRLDLVAARA